MRRDIVSITQTKLRADSSTLPMTMIDEHAPLAFCDVLPKQVDVVVIGGGIIGISTAWFLVKNGLSVLVCEKGRIAGEQSSRNWGWVRQQGRDYAELPIVMDSLTIWDGLMEEVGEDLGFTRKGVLYLGETETDLAEYEDWLDIAKQHQLDTRLLTSREVDELIVDSPGQWLGGLYTASDGRAEPFQAVPAIARALQHKGCKIKENCAVRVLDEKAGAVCGVVTECGVVEAQAVVCAGGAWSSMFMRNAGIALPQLTVRATVARTGKAPDIFQGNAASADLAFRRRKDGGYTVALSDFAEHFLALDSCRHFSKFLPSLRASWSATRFRFSGDLMKRFSELGRWTGDAVSPFERTRVLNPPPSEWAVRQMSKRLKKRLPRLSEVTFEESWAGMIDTTPDFVPVMDEVPGKPKFYVATGFSGHGFGIGPGAGRVMADMVLGRSPAHALERFRFSRFTDGTRMVLGPVL